MPIPNPRSFFGKKCVIRLKSGASVVRIIKNIDITGVIVDEEDGVTTVYPFKDVDHVSLAK